MPIRGCLVSPAIGKRAVRLDRGQVCLGPREPGPGNRDRELVGRVIDEARRAGDTGLIVGYTHGDAVLFGAPGDAEALIIPADNDGARD